MSCSHFIPLFSLHSFHLIPAEIVMWIWIWICLTFAVRQKHKCQTLVRVCVCVYLNGLERSKDWSDFYSSHIYTLTHTHSRKKFNLLIYYRCLIRVLQALLARPRLGRTRLHMIRKVHACIHIRPLYCSRQFCFPTSANRGFDMGPVRLEGMGMGMHGSGEENVGAN